MSQRGKWTEKWPCISDHNLLKLLKHPWIFSFAVSLLLLERSYFPFIQLSCGVHASDRSKYSQEIFEAFQKRSSTPWGYVAEGTTFSTDTHACSNNWSVVWGTEARNVFVVGAGSSPWTPLQEVKELLTVFWQQRRRNGRCEGRYLNLQARAHNPVGRTFVKPLTNSNVTLKWASKVRKFESHQ